MSNTVKKWVLLLLLSFIWGSSFILIKKGLLGFCPLQLGSFRLVISALIIFAFGFKSLKGLNKNQWKWLALSGFLGGVAAFLILSANSQITPMFGMWCTVKGLVAMMIGGVGSLIGAVFGGLILGLLETFVLFNIGVEFRELATFGILFLVLIIKPGGLLGGKSFMLSREIDERV